MSKIFKQMRKITVSEPKESWTRSLLPSCFLWIPAHHATHSATSFRDTTWAFLTPQYHPDFLLLCTYWQLPFLCLPSMWNEYVYIILSSLILFFLFGFQNTSESCWQQWQPQSHRLCFPIWSNNTVEQNLGPSSCCSDATFRPECHRVYSTF